MGAQGRRDDGRRPFPNPLAMQYPLHTGEGARAIGATEPRLNRLIRRGKIVPAPPLRSGRRLWDRGHLLQAAVALGLLTDALRAELGEEVST